MRLLDLASGIPESNNAIEGWLAGPGILRIGKEIAPPLKLDPFPRLHLAERRLKLRTFQNFERIRIQIHKNILPLRKIVRIFRRKKMVIKPDLG